MATIHPPTEIPPARTAMPPPSPMPDPSPIPPPSSAPVEEAQLPFAGYDRAGEQQLIHGLSEHTQVELEAAESYERSHKQGGRTQQAALPARRRAPSRLRRS